MLRVLAIQAACVDIQSLDSIHPQLVGVYRTVFTLPPYGEGEADVQDFAARFSDHIQRPGFRCCVARHDADGLIVGFAYGFTAEPGDGWWESVADGLTEDEVKTWLDDSFALAELAVTPEMQGRGLGGQLHDALLKDLPHRAAVLSTIQAETPAMRLYRKRGWVTLLRDFWLDGMTYPYVVMGLALHKH
jgi:GNAT superfamily N-acetyltransferase